MKTASKFEENREEKIALERYVFKPFRGSSHYWALQHFGTLPTSCKVLDVGPGSGFAALQLAELGIKDIFAIEPDTKTAASLSTLYKKIVPSLTELNEENFDLIILMDVLEHMAEPEKFFSSAKKLLKPGGKVLISVPNVAHWSIRFPLLFGFFEYQERGPMDRTHLQFFSKRRFHKLIKKDSSLKLIDQNFSIEPLDLVLPHFICNTSLFNQLSKARQFLAKLLPGLMAYQFLALVEVNKTDENS